MSRSKQPTAVLVAVRLPAVDEAELEASLSELERLVTTLGYRAIARVVQARTSFAPAAVLGEGKLKELADLTGGTGNTGPAVPRKASKAQRRREAEDALDTLDTEDEPEPSEDSAEGEPATLEPRVDLVAVDHDITPSQLRNLERATGTVVLDRTGIIIEIFHRHARSREARLQVEIARLNYSAPRLRESGRGSERQHFRGSGDSALELDRRRIRDRIAELRQELARVQREQDLRRERRREARRVALVGYTNAGKSSLMRALTGSDVHIEDKLFATLDTTVRALHPPAHPRILVSDTVGFIKKLPHDLVASFKSTLDEAAEASLLLHVIDASDPSWSSQLEVTRQVLAEIGAAGGASFVVMNKIDRLSERELSQLRMAQPDAWFISAKSPADVAGVRERLIAFFETEFVEAELLVPYDRQRWVSEMHEAGRVLEERYEEQGVVVRLRADAQTLEKLRARLA
jgi:GTP-binding protein HflX